MPIIFDLIIIAKTMSETYPGELSEMSPFAYFSGVGAISALGSIAKMLGQEDVPITGRVMATYLVCGVTAGLIVALLTIEKEGSSMLLVGVCGVAGFGSIQIMTTLSKTLQKIIRKFTD